jgi:hypothetical protein
MNADGKSDTTIVPKKSPNKGHGAPWLAEAVEGREVTKRNATNRTGSGHWNGKEAR